MEKGELYRYIRLDQLRRARGPGTRRCVTLLIDEAARQASPDYVPFLLRKKTPVWVRLWRALVRLIRGVI